MIDPIEPQGTASDALYDETPSGYVETLKGCDGKLRQYVRLVDHEIIVRQLLKQLQSVQSAEALDVDPMTDLICGLR